MRKRRRRRRKRTNRQRWRKLLHQIFTLKKQTFKREASSCPRGWRKEDLPCRRAAAPQCRGRDGPGILHLRMKSLTQGAIADGCRGHGGGGGKVKEDRVVTGAKQQPTENVVAPRKDSTQGSGCRHHR